MKAIATIVLEPTDGSDPIEAFVVMPEELAKDPKAVKHELLAFFEAMVNTWLKEE